MPTVVAAWTKVIVDYAAAQGVTVPTHGVDLSRPDSRISAHIDDLIWEAADRAIGDPDLGIHIAERGITAAGFGVVGYLIRASATVGEAIVRAGQFHRLIKDRGHCDLQLVKNDAMIVDVPEADRPAWPRPIAELIMANYVQLTRVWTRERVMPREVRFQHARPRDIRELERFFGTRLKFDQPQNAVIFDRGALELPLTTAEPGLAMYLELAAQTRLDQMPAPSLIDEVKTAIADELRAGDVDIERVASRVGATPRSLQRRLRGEGTSYRELVDAVRHLRAMELLRRGLTFDDIAARLGFSEARAFRRAFRRWTGLVPSALLRGT